MQEEMGRKHALHRLFCTLLKPPTNCKPSKPANDDYEDYYSSLVCEVNGLTYSDLDEIPSDDPCNSCYCDYGEIACTKDLCGGLPNMETGKQNILTSIKCETKLR